MLVKIYPENPNPREIQLIVECLKDGGIIIYPTDTIYGIGCDIFKPKSIERIVECKCLDFEALSSELFHKVAAYEAVSACNKYVS